MKPGRREFIKSVSTAGALLGTAVEAKSGAPRPETKVKVPTPRAKALMDLFGLKYPIFAAPIGTQSSPELALAVSNAGAMGALSAFAFSDSEAAHRSVSRVRSGTKGNFFVNFVLQFEPTALQAVLDAGAPIVQFSWGIPTKEMIAAVRAAGAKLGIQVTSAESTRAAVDLGADFLVCQGTEAGGHVQATRTLYETLPIVLEVARDKPVVAAGGIGNGHGIYQALAAGASGAVLGTRFVATAESFAHEDYKRALVAAHAKDTALTICFQDGWSATHRVLRNRTFVMWETAGCLSPGKRPGEHDTVARRTDGTVILRYEDTGPQRGFTGSVTECPMWAGTSVELVKDLPNAAELVERLWGECLAASSVADVVESTARRE